MERERGSALALTKPIEINNIGSGGVADSLYSGAQNSVARLVGWNLHETPGLLKVSQKMTKNSASVVDELCKVAVETSTGDKYFFSSESGKIWKEGSPYTLAHTTTPVIGEAKCLGAYEFGGFLYWFTQDWAHRIPATTTALADWSTYASHNIAPLGLDQSIGDTGQTYTLTAAIDEGATHRQTFIPFNSPIHAFGVHLTTVSTGNVTVTLHDSSNNSLGTVTIAAASLTTGYNYFVFSTDVDVTKGSTYHIHVTSTVADGTVTTSVSSDLEGGLVRILRSADDEFHPCLEHLGVLFIGDRHYVHQIEETSTGAHAFTTEALDVREPLRVKCLGKDPYNLLVGTTVSSTLLKTQIFKWNTYEDSFTTSDEIPEVGINAFLPADNTILVHAGLGGNIYIYDPGSGALELLKSIPGEFTPSKKATVHPNAVGSLAGKTLIGVSNLAGNPVDQGVWTFARHSRDYPFVFDLTYPISERSGGNFVLTGVEIGAILVSGFDVYVAYTDGTNHGIDKLDYSNKLDGAFIESRLYMGDRAIENNFAQASIFYSSLPASTSFTLAHKVNHDSSFTNYSNLLSDTDRDMYIADEEVTGVTYEIKAVANTNSNDAPTLEGISIKMTQ